MSRKHYSDPELIKAIQAGGSGRKEALRFLYSNGQVRQKIVRFVMKNQGDMNRARDIYHDGIIILDQNLRSGKYRGEGSLPQYLNGICCNLWLKALRKERRITLVDPQAEEHKTIGDTPESIAINQEMKKILDQVLNQLDKRCRKLLSLWQLQYSMEEIARELQLSNAAMARKNRYRCHKKLMEKLKDHPQMLKALKSWQ